MNYYRKFIKGFLGIATLLIKLIYKDTLFIQNYDCEEAFKELKYRLATTLILTIFDLEREAILETNASNYAIDTYLIQKDNDKKLRTVVYYSRKITGLELNYNIYNKELLVVVKALREQRVYLERIIISIQIYIDYKNLLYWTTTKQLNRRQIRQAETLAFYSFRINYVRGTENRRVNIFSRRSNYLRRI